MKGQWIVLTALAVVVAVAVIYMAYVSSTIVPVASIQRPAYGIMSQNWPELVQLLSGYATFLAQSAASKISSGALDAGLYNNLLQTHPNDIYFQLQATSQYAASALSAVEQSLIPLGTFVAGSYAIDQGGFGGTLGPYPAAVILSDAYNFSYWWNMGALSAPGVYKVYRFVVTPYSQILNSDYVIIYSADVRRPTSVGESYSVPIADILNQARSGNGYDASLLKQKLYLILVNNTALGQAVQYYVTQGCNYHNPNVVGNFSAMLARAFVQLPWWSEYLKCPFCLFDFKMPRGSLASPGVSDEVMVLLYSQPTSSVYLTLNIPLMMQAFGKTPPSKGPNFCYDSANYQYVYQTPASPSLNNNPYAVYNFSGINGFFNAAAMASWPSSITYSMCHQVGPENTPTPIEQLVTTSVYGNSTTGLLLGAIYPAGTYDVGYQIWNGFTVPSNWPGFQVRVLVNITNPNEDEMGYLALFWGGYDGTTFPWCADMVAVQPKANPQEFTWSYLPQGFGSGPWHIFSWQQGIAYSSMDSNRWYILSISQTNTGNIYLSVYKFLSNSTGPMTLYSARWIQSQSFLRSFNIVLGTDVEDATMSTDWNNTAVYDFLAVRPWAYPEPSAVLTTLGSAPVVNPPRQIVLAYGTTSYVRSSASLLGNISLALVTDLNINRTISVNATTKYVLFQRINATYNLYTYGVLVKANAPRSALSTNFAIYLNYGGILYNYTCGVVNVCNQTLATYYGYFGGIDVALYNVTFLVPRHSSFAVVAQLLGAQLAVNNLTVVHPQVYYIWSGNSLYLINIGNMDAVFYFPWQSGRPIVQSVTPNDGVFGARLDIAGPNGNKWTLVIVPPASAVNVTLTAGQQNINLYAPTWEQQFLYQAPLGSNCRLLQVYFPSNYAGTNLTLIIPPAILNSLGFKTSTFNTLSFTIFTSNGWSPPLKYSVAGWGDVWLNVAQNKGWFAYRGTLLQICPTSTKQSSAMSAVAIYYNPSISQSTYAIGKYANLAYYPDGFAVVVNASSPPSQVMLTNTTQFSAWCSIGTPAGSFIAIFRGSSGFSPWLNQYAGYCYNQFIWNTNGTGSEIYFVLALTKQFASYHIATMSNNLLNTYDKWWFNSLPNTAYNSILLACSSCNGPFKSFNYVYVTGTTYGIVVIPYTWPLPYFILDGQIYQTI
ncbi:hypothetical protein TUZN_0591 [Thermoproteus uzoniensis 768-20]|uniref:Uncharacterized protein n=1 Tax=Thermoproteus uzoniensis (strain 768-20) TaxID=999630 RepID=F2L429_THEU7|nr:hypothetical protein [Thermoproteus uzoniensis]AEA12085.1 hypothetical protein TUZN_0591 [Thermoproteus uzoniensis 768-20]